VNNGRHDELTQTCSGQRNEHGEQSHHTAIVDKRFIALTVLMESRAVSSREWTATMARWKKVSAMTQ
jgi:hypothetical protein